MKTQIHIKIALLLLGLITIINFQAIAQAHKENKLGPISSLNLGIRYSSLYENRGVILYDGYQIDPVVGVFFFNDRLEFLGDSISYRDFIYSDQIRLRTRLQSITDNPLYPAVDSKKRTDREDSVEWQNKIELFTPGYNENYIAEFDLGFSKDLSAHNGLYIDFTSKLKLFDFSMDKLKILIEPNLFFTLGYGDENHNQYFYGPQAADAGLNNLSYGLWFNFPNEADRNYPIIQIKHFEVLGKQRLEADYAKDNSSGWMISFIATGGIL